MSLKLYERYPGRFSPATSAYPQGAFKNRTAPGAKDGSYLEQDWANDKEGFFGSLLRAAGITANGTPDTALASQYFDALRSLGLRQATEAQTGVLRIASLVAALAGSDDTTGMTPAKVKAVTTALLPKRSFGPRDYIRIPDVPGGLIVQWVLDAPEATSAADMINFPVPFPTARLGVSGTLNALTTGGLSQTTNIVVLSNNLTNFQYASGGTYGGGAVAYILAWGY